MDPALLAEMKERLGGVLNARWKLIKIIGVGASAAVYRAVDPDGWTVAVKVLHQKYRDSRTISARFAREQRILSDLDHPNVLRIHDTGTTTDGLPYSAMELLEGATLARLMKKRGEVPLELDRTIEFILPVLDVLQMCHGRDIIHRDLKPANIFLTTDRVIKVLDFGVARIPGGGDTRLTRAGTALGTPAFMSPEQARGHIDLLDARSDLFSIGAMLHYLLAGRYIHEGDSSQQIYVKAAKAKAPSLAQRAPQLPPEIISIVDRAVAWEPESRWQTASDLADALRALPAPNPAAEPERARVETLRAWSSVARATDGGASARGRTEHLRDIWAASERALETMRRHGPHHPISRARSEEVFGFIERALTEGKGHVVWEVRPSHFEDPLTSLPCWEPSPEWSWLPYDLFACGIRRIKLNTALNAGEYHRFLETIISYLIGERRSWENDLALQLWDRRLIGIECDIGSLLGTPPMYAHYAIERAFDARREAIEETIRSEFQLEGDRVRMLEHSEEPALAAAERLLTATTLSPPSDNAEDTALLQMRADHRHQSKRWVVRLGTTMGDVTADALRQGDAQRLLEPLGQLAKRLARAGRVAQFMELLGVMMERLRHPEIRARLVSSSIDPELLRQLFEDTGVLIDDDDDLHASRTALSKEQALSLTRIIDHLDDRHLEVALEAVQSLSTPAEQVREPLLEMIRAQMSGHEPMFGAALSTAPAPLATRFIELLVAQGATGLRALHRGLEHGDPSVQLSVVRALVPHSASSQATNTLRELIRSGAQRTRTEAMQLVVDADLTALAPHLKEAITAPDFHHLPLDERRGMLEMLHQLDAPSAEGAAVQILSDADATGSAAGARTQIVAAEFLGKHGRTHRAQDALRAAQQRPAFGTSRDVQQAATRALHTWSTRRGE